MKKAQKTERPASNAPQRVQPTALPRIKGGSVNDAEASAGGEAIKRVAVK